MPPHMPMKPPCDADRCRPDEHSAFMTGLPRGNGGSRLQGRWRRGSSGAGYRTYELWISLPVITIQEWSTRVPPAGETSPTRRAGSGAPLAAETVDGYGAAYTSHLGHLGIWANH
jgi:hypothetical protein